jgi:prepilin-type N-terminal cleavage/methylation domain-containing protein
MNTLTKRENGFSLLELAVALALALIFSGISITMAPSLITNVRSGAISSSECSFEKETVANKYLNGQEHSDWNTSPENSACNITSGDGQ